MDPNEGEGFYFSQNIFLDELLRNGTTTALVLATVHPQSVDAVFEAARSRRLRLLAGIGSGVGNYLSYGDFPMDNSSGTGSLFFPRGIIMGKDLANVMEMDEKKISEYVTHSWYSYEGGDDKGLNPFVGETTENYNGPEGTFEYLNTDDKYTWVKAPRYADRPGQPL